MVLNIMTHYVCLKEGREEEENASDPLGNMLVRWLQDKTNYRVEDYRPDSVVCHSFSNESGLPQF